MPTTIKLQVVRIPYDGSPMKLTTVPLINVGAGGIHKDECEDDTCKTLEKELEHTLDMNSLNNPKAVFSPAHRHLLIGQPYKSAGHPSWSADYIMYTCLKDEAGLPQNKYLKELTKDLASKGRATLMEEIKVYGDAFVFKMKSKSQGPAEPQPAEFIDMDASFILSTQASNPILLKLLMYPRKGDWK